MILLKTLIATSILAILSELKTSEPPAEAPNISYILAQVVRSKELRIGTPAKQKDGSPEGTVGIAPDQPNNPRNVIEQPRLAENGGTDPGTTPEGTVAIAPDQPNSNVLEQPNIAQATGSGLQMQELRIGTPAKQKDGSPEGVVGIAPDQPNNPGNVIEQPRLAQMSFLRMEQLAIGEATSADSVRIAVGTLTFAGTDFTPVRNSVGPLRMTGTDRLPEREQQRAITRNDRLPSSVKVALLRVSPLDNGTNPFDSEDLRRDIETARETGGSTTTTPETDGNTTTTPITPSPSTGLTIANGLPFQELTGPGPVDGILGFVINGAGDTLTIVDGGPPPPGFSIVLAEDFGGALVAADGGSFTLVSTTPSNPVLLGIPATAIVKRNSDGTFYQIKFTLGQQNPMIINSVTADDCGTSLAGCP